MQTQIKQNRHTSIHTYRNNGEHSDKPAYMHTEIHTEITKKGNTNTTQTQPNITNDIHKEQNTETNNYMNTKRE